MEAWEESGITQTEYCQLHGLECVSVHILENPSLRKRLDTGTIIPIQINPGPVFV